jgi:hypothetical protein
MKITIIGTTAYQDRMMEHKKGLESKGHNVSLPAFDNFSGMNEFQVCEYNRSKIEWSDEIHVIWDQRSIGTVFDLGMSFALGKTVKIIYLNEKTFPNFLRQYADNI